MVVISTHALVQRAAECAAAGRELEDDFNPRPRAEGGGGSAALVKRLKISTHALVQRAATHNKLKC
mgnify:CR=1 FL=1